MMYPRTDGAEIIRFSHKLKKYFFAEKARNYAGFGFFSPKKRKTKFDSFLFLDILVGKSNIPDLRGCAVLLHTPSDACMYISFFWRCAMEKERQKIEQNADELSQEQRYTVGRTVFIVTPVFKETGEATLASALMRLMRNDIDNQ